MGEMADVVLHGTKVSAEKMLKQGFTFQFAAFTFGRYLYCSTQLRLRSNSCYQSWK